MNQLLILLCMCFGVQGLNVKNNVTFGSLPAKERNRRLIPYMTFYLGQPQNAQYRQVMAVPYIAVPQYRPVPQRFIQQQTPLTRMITQNYLNLAKQLQDNPRGQVRVNPNYQSEMKYYAQLLNHDLNGPQEARVQYAKPQHILQFTRPQTQEQYPKQAENDYEQTEENPQENNHYAKPSPDALVHYMKPEVQQYVTKVNSPSIHYTKGEQDDYDDTTQQRIPIRYPQYATSNEYTNNLDLQQTSYNSKPENFPSAYIQKPLLQYGPKITITPSKLAPQPADYPEYITGPSHNPNIHHQGDDITPSKLTPQPADIPEYITRPIHKTNLHHKGDKTSITIMQSQEIDVDVLPSTPATPKYHATYVAKPHSYVSYPIQTAQAKPEEELDPEIVDKNFNDILQGVSLSKTLPERITTENLDSSIKTLSKILRILQRANTLPQSAKHIVKGFPKPAETLAKAPKLKLKPHQQYNDGSTPGRAHIDYPAYDEIPQTNFNCKDQRYKGFFGDPETRCQVWHYCDLNGGQASFLCPNGTIFSQVALTCDWWFNVKCASTAQLYVLNERLYKYILPQKPSFPEDYSGPLVDHYLALKFKEIEEKNKNKTEEHKEEKEEEEEPPFSIDEATQNKVRSVE